MQSLGQALAPAFVTTLFAYSIQSRILGGNLAYSILFLINTFGAFQSFRLKEVEHDIALNQQKRVSGANDENGV